MSLFTPSQSNTEVPLCKEICWEQWTKIQELERVAQVKVSARPPSSSASEVDSSPSLQDTPRNCERYLNWAHAFLVVYSVDSRQSFESSSSYLELLALHAKETQRSYPALLLGNKLDMAQYR